MGTLGVSITHPILEKTATQPIETAKQKRERNLTMEKSIKKYFPIFALPTLVAFVTFFLIPFILGIYLSFCRFTTISDATFVGMSNYLEIFKDATFVHALWYTALFTLASVVTINVIAFTVAMLLTKAIPGTNIFRTVFFMPNLIGGIVLGYIWQLIFNGILLYFNKTLTFSASYGFWGLVILTNWQQIGYMMIIYIAGIQNIPTALLEAAKIDGCTAWREFWSIIFPLTFGTYSTFFLMSLCGVFAASGPILYMTQGAANTTTLGYWLFSQVIRDSYNYPAAVGVVFTLLGIPILIISRAIINKMTPEVTY